MRIFLRKKFCQVKLFTICLLLHFNLPVFANGIVAFNVPAADAIAETNAINIQKTIDKAQAYNLSHPTKAVRVVFKPYTHYDIDRPIICRPGVSIYGLLDPNNKKASRAIIRNTSTSKSAYKSAIFIPGNFHPAYTRKIPYDQIEFIDNRSFRFKSGSSQNLDLLVLKGVSITEETFVSEKLVPMTRYAVGDIIVFSSLGNYSTYLPPYDSLYYPRNMRFNKIASIEGSTYKLEEDIGINNLKDLSGAYNINSFTSLATSYKKKLTNFGNPLFIFSNAIVANLVLKTNSDSHIFADSAAYKARFLNLTTEGKTSIYVNSFQSSEFQNIDGFFYSSLGEISHNSYNLAIDNIDFTFSSSKLYNDPTDSGSKAAVFGIQENSENITISNARMNIRENFSGSAILKVMNANNVVFKNIYLRGASDFLTPSWSIIQLGGNFHGKNDSCKNNKFFNIISTIPAARFIKLNLYNDLANANKIKDNVISNSYFVGDVSQEPILVGAGSFIEKVEINSKVVNKKTYFNFSSNNLSLDSVIMNKANGTPYSDHILKYTKPPVSGNLTNGNLDN